MRKIAILALAIFSLAAHPPHAFGADLTWEQLRPFFHRLAEYAGRYGPYKSVLKFKDGTPVKTAADWAKRRKEILAEWQKFMGPWPPLLDKPEIKVREKIRRDNFTQEIVRVDIASNKTTRAYLLIPDGQGPFPAVIVPYYEPETSIGLSDQSCATSVINSRAAASSRCPSVPPPWTPANPRRPA